MAVYVDRFMAQLGRMKMSHMVADTPDELHRMASVIGVARRHFQERASAPHYDVCASKRRLAIEHGAIELADRREFVQRVGSIKTGGEWKRVDGRWMAAK